MTVPAWTKGVLLLAVTFAAGAASGVRYERRREPTHDAAGMHSDQQLHSDHMMQRFTQDLGLDSVQQQAVAAIFTRHQQVIDSTWHAVQPHVHATLDSTLREIAGVLRPGQAAKFRSMIETRHQGSLP